MKQPLCKRMIADAFRAEAKGDDSIYAPGKHRSKTIQSVLRRERNTLQW